MRESQKFLENFNSQISQADTVTLRHNENSSIIRKTKPMSKYAEEKDEENNITTKREEYPETKFTAKHADYFKTY